MYLTLNQAAKETGKSKGTISRYLKTGKLSYVEKTDKGYKLDPAEVFRVFKKSKPNTGTIEQFATPNEHTQNSHLEVENKFLHEKIMMLEKMVEDSTLREKDLSVKLDKSQDTLKAQTMVLQDMREKPPEKSVEPRKKILGIF